jgi:hypothetical protein
MPESLLSFSNILLFGEPVYDLEVVNPVPIPPEAAGDNAAENAAEGEDAQGDNDRDPVRERRRAGPNRQLAAQLVDNNACYAKIYGFSYEGRYYDMARPTLFLVHDVGELVTLADNNAPNPSRALREPALSGLSVADFDFADEIRVWSYDKADYTIRMDVETGRFEQLLLEAEMDEDELASFYSGQRARIGGQRARVGGQRARVSGQRVRINNRGGD